MAVPRISLLSIFFLGAALSPPSSFAFLFRSLRRDIGEDDGIREEGGSIIDAVSRGPRVEF